MPEKFEENVKISGRILKSNIDDFISKMTEITSGRVSVNVISEKFEY